MLRDGGRARQQLEGGRGQGEFWLHRLEPWGPGQCTAGMVPTLCPASSFSCLLWTLCPKPGWGLGEVVHLLPQGGALRPGNLWAGRHLGASGSRQSEPAGRLQEAGSRQVRLRVREQSRQRHKAWAGCGSCTGWGLFLSWGFMCQLAQSAHLWGPWDTGRPSAPTPTPSPSGPSWGLGLVGASPCSAPLWWLCASY